MYYRSCIKNVLEALSDTPVVLICGARQVGKSTLMKLITETVENFTYFSMDDPSILSATSKDATAFLKNIKGRIVIDEIQRAPELFLAIKNMVDQSREPGKFLLTGSANVLSIPRVSDSLAGRMEIINMWPLSQGEIARSAETFLAKCFDAGKFSNNYECEFSDIINRIVKGGYPEVLTRASHERRTVWFNSYLNSILQRDIRDISGIEGIRELPQLLSLLITRAGNIINLSDISRLSQIPWSTLKRYVYLLETIYLISFVPGWYMNYEKRVVKAPKLYFNDTGMLCYLYGVSESTLLRGHILVGSILENFVFQELSKQISWHQEKISLFTFRTPRGKEVDFILEKQNGDIVGIEVKSKIDIQAKDFEGLQELKSATGHKFKMGYVLYTGTKKINFAEDLVALPITALWN